MIITGNITFNFKYVNSSDEDEKDEGWIILPEASLTESYKSL